MDPQSIGQRSPDTEGSCVDPPSIRSGKSGPPRGAITPCVEGEGVLEESNRTPPLANMPGKLAASEK